MKGVTLIEAIIVASIIGIIASIAIPAFMGKHSDSTVSFGYNGMTESRCIDGYRFIVSNRGEARQIMDEFGKGVKCN